MPVDHKRINGPEESVPYELFARLSGLTSEKAFEQLYKAGKRSDGREFEEHRKIFLKNGAVSQAKGSAYIEMGQTKVIVSVFDPREIPNRSDYSLKGELYCEFKFAPFSCAKRRLHQQDNEEKQYSCIMKKALESAVCLHELPNFQVDIYALVMHNDGSALSAAITAAGVALVEAGVPMYDIITSVTVGIQQGVKLVDPDSLEEQMCQVQFLSEKYQDNNHGLLIISKLHTQEQLCQFYQNGYVSLEVLKSGLEVLSKTCEVIVPLVQKCLIKHITNGIKS
ncbi:exosome complex component MTR3-like [Sitophilus oryzae]|uniref:Exosome complex component MTR3-like n=1 Tax=Sitophilus oryzae TaxID=7048 RepID=A0A6J2YAG5_SITOR|nr:exosome complex component MTR3-like [Sitophilus oryzae]